MPSTTTKKENGVRRPNEDTSQGKNTIKKVRCASTHRSGRHHKPTHTPQWPTKRDPRSPHQCTDPPPANTATPGWYHHKSCSLQHLVATKACHASQRIFSFNLSAVYCFSLSLFLFVFLLLSLGLCFFCVFIVGGVVASRVVEKDKAYCYQCWADKLDANTRSSDVWRSKLLLCKGGQIPHNTEKGEKAVLKHNHFST